MDYSNTVFYKIYCNDPSIKEIYIGHTTNFVQRKYAHKQGCINIKSTNYNCKVYKIIRDNMGWDNWTMEIIAFHNCEDLYSAKKQEQHYFEEYKATLNSIEPLPPRKPKKEAVVKPQPEVLYCNSCKVYFTTRKLQEEHNKRPRHLKFSIPPTDIIDNVNTSPTISSKYECKMCNYTCSKQSDYTKHTLTRKHTNLTIMSQPVTPDYVCDCGKVYKARNSLWYHKQRCEQTYIQPRIASDPESAPHQIDNDFIAELLKDNNALREMMIEQNKQIIDIVKNSRNTMNNDN